MRVGETRALTTLARVPIFVAVLFAFASFGGSACAQMPQRPRLVLQITVDQLRGDMPRRDYNRLGEGGFRYLMEQGTVYLDAHHRHANTETIVGHTTLATGADPAAHGMVGNVWLDRESGELTYNVEDANYPLLAEGVGAKPGGW